MFNSKKAGHEVPGVVAVLCECMDGYRFHLTLCLLSDGSQMMSNCGKNKKVAHEPLGECIADVHTILDVFCDLSLDRRRAT